MASATADCPVCGSVSVQEYGRRKLWSLTKCSQCDSVYRTVFPTQDELDEIYGSDYYDSWNIEANAESFWQMKIKNSTSYLKALDKYLPIRQDRTLLDVGCAHGFMLESASQLGYVPSGLEISPAGDMARERGFHVVASNLEDRPFPPESFDVVTMIDVIEHLTDPLEALRCVYTMLKPEGIVFVVTPDIGSLSARIMRSTWPHYLPEHLIYYSPSSLQTLFDRTGLDVMKIGPGYKYLTINYILGHLRSSLGGLIPRVVWSMANVLPSPFTGKPLRYRTEMIAVGRKRTSDLIATQD